MQLATYKTMERHEIFAVPKPVLVARSVNKMEICKNLDVSYS